MFCEKCGRIIEENSKFCEGCGAPIEVDNIERINNTTTNVKQPLNTNTVQNENYNTIEQNQNYDDIVNPSMKKYAVLCILIPSLSIIVYWNIGLSIYVATLLAILGFNFSKKAKLNYRTASIIGYILNGILVAMIIFMLFAYLVIGRSDFAVINNSVLYSIIMNKYYLA